MIGCLRLIGILNAAIWLGAAMFATFGASPGTASLEMRALFGPSDSAYVSGAIGLILMSRFFRWQLACGLIALAHLVVEGLYLGKGLRRFRLGLLLVLFWLTLMSGLWLQPKLQKLHLIGYGAGIAPARRQAAQNSFHAWHTLAQALNFLSVGGLAVYVWRVANPPDAARFVSAVKFRS